MRSWPLDVASVMRVPHIADRAAAYGMPGCTIDGNDVLSVLAAARQAIDALRAFCRGEKRIDAHAPGAAAHSSKMPE